MADRTQLKIAEKNDIAEEDPFAELTRIMGFDPRQPVARQDMGAPAGRAEPAMDDDFGIDLEKELLGELAGDDLTAAPEHDLRAAYALPDESVAYAAVEAPVVYAPVDEPVYARASQPEFAAEASFDDAVAASFDQEFSLENELLGAEAPASYAAEPAYAEPAYAAATTYPAQAAYAVETAYGAEPAYAVEPSYAAAEEANFGSESAFDDAVAASLEQHFTLEDDLAPFEATEAAVEAPAAYAAKADSDLDADFDVALADVDMDFETRESAEASASEVDDQLTLGAYQPAEPEQLFSDADLDTEEQVATVPVVPAHDYDEFERSLQDALSDEEPAFEAAPAAAYQTTYAPVAAVEPVAVAVKESSLEDELNALLGSMSSQSKALSGPAPLRAVSEPEAVEPAATYIEPQSWAAEQPVATEPEVYAANAVTDYAASSYRPEEPQSEYGPIQEAMPAHAEESFVEPGLEAQGQAEDDVSFDDDAFDVAFERSVEADLAEPAVPAPVQPQPLRPLAASRYEQARSWGLGTPVAPRPVVPAAEAPQSYKPEAFAPRAEPAAYVPQSVEAYEPQPAAYVPQAEPEAYAPQAEPAFDAQDDLEAELYAAVSAFDDVPDIETVDVPEKAVALADDLDIPELSFEDDTPPAPAYDDLDGDFTNLMNEMNTGETGAKSGSSSYASNPYAAGFDRKALREGDVPPAQSIDFPAAAAGSVAGASAMYAGGQAARSDDRVTGFDLGGTPQGRANLPREQATVDEFGFDPDFDETIAIQDLPGSAAVARPARRGAMIAALVGAVAVIGGLGAWAFSFGGSEGAGAPVIVKADESPIKIKPENPGGATVPNQDSKVYDRVAGGAANGAPAQEKLVTNTEEPVDVVAQDAEARAADAMPLDADEPEAVAPTSKSEDRVQQAMQADQPDANTETAAVAPRKVRTMVVKPDGTLVPREEPVPAAIAATEPSDPAPQRVAEPGSEATGTVPTAAAAKPALAPVATPAQSAKTPTTAPIAPQRPSQQPVDVVGEVKPDQVAAVAPSAPTAAASGAWAMQIASQPSEEAAKSTYQDLVRRYGSVLNGHEVSIVKAEIAGKGTFWRVRVPAGSRNDAVSLCESYKAAGGNCFVSK